MKKFFGWIVGIAGIAHSVDLFAVVVDGSVIRLSPTEVELSWFGAQKVDVLQRTYDQSMPEKFLVKAYERSSLIVKDDGIPRLYVIRDVNDGSQLITSERTVPLAQGSNFRDVGGYRTVDGNRVRWGMLFRSGGQPQLNDRDLEIIKSLGLRRVVDLRSREERSIAPTRIDGVPYEAVGYSFNALVPSGKTPAAPGSIYSGFAALLAPHVRIITRNILNGETPLVFNCSAGQDRTGFVTAILLSAIGVDNGDIERDYLASTDLRRPQYEMPMLDPKTVPVDSVAMFFARAQQSPDWLHPKPLVSSAGEPLIRLAMRDVRERWGSVENYLNKEVGLSELELKRLRAILTE